MDTREPGWVVGIDLGTTHTVVAAAPFAPSQSGAGALVDVPITQATGPQERAALPQLPSALYLPASGELPTEALDHDVVVGEFARAQGAKVPGRLIVSAKSWLCVPGVDRTSPILPWAALDGVQKLSPVDVPGGGACSAARAHKVWSARAFCSSAIAVRTWARSAAARGRCAVVEEPMCQGGAEQRRVWCDQGRL